MALEGYKISDAAKSDRGIERVLHVNVSECGPMEPMIICCKPHTLLH